MEPTKKTSPRTEEDPLATTNPANRDFQDINEDTATGAEDLDELKGSVGDDEELFDEDEENDVDDEDEDEEEDYDDDEDLEDDEEENDDTKDQTV